MSTTSFKLVFTVWIFRGKIREAANCVVESILTSEIDRDPLRQTPSLCLLKVAFMKKA